jgi:hypothetical protein
VIPNIYSSLTDISKEGYALASDSIHYFYIDTKGKKAFPQLDTLQVKQMEGFSKGFANIVLTTGESVYLDRFGNILYTADLRRLREKYFQ